MYYLTAEERETAINFDDSSQEAKIYTANAALRRKLDKLCEQYPEAYKIQEVTESSTTYVCNKKLIKFGKPVNISEEERKARSENMRRIRLRDQSEKER